MAFSERRVRRQIRETKASLASLEDRLGRLMSLRVSREEQLADLYGELQSNGLPIEGVTPEPVEPVVTCPDCGITVFASSNNTTGRCTGCEAKAQR